MNFLALKKGKKKFFLGTSKTQKIRQIVKFSIVGVTLTIRTKKSQKSAKMALIPLFFDSPGIHCMHAIHSVCPKSLVHGPVAFPTTVYSGQDFWDIQDILHAKYFY